ncbi:unnamed protein product [Rotaria magnacalcarata]|uniref:Uncharacterized protein n=1 Tax=Rotaria magnacalcarata TaxID=392030 RepID=A0A814YXX2_9BILA|nr:unnamed protein product [Rotaria magnacalcarata]
MPFKKARYVNFKTVLITVISYTLVSTFVSLWCPVTVNCTRDKRKSGVKCELLRPTVYKNLLALCANSSNHYAK